jgi:chemotaxis protein methyltransferase CheR
MARASTGETARSVTILHSAPRPRAGAASPAADEPRIGALSRALNLDLGDFRSEHVQARVAGALEREGLGDWDVLLRLARRDPATRTRLRRSIAIGFTARGRDPEQLALLERRLLPPLLAEGRALRIWSAGCSTGAELCDLAEALARREARPARLLGSDLLDENVAVASAGHADGRPCACALAGARYEQRDVVRGGSPGGRWDLVLCRNVAIYLGARARALLHAAVAGALAPGGILMLGRSERLADPAALGLERAGPHAYRRRDP